MIDIAISTNVLPHYRYAVHKALCERTDAKVLTYAGRNCLEPLKLSTEAQYSEVGAINCPATIIRFSKNFAFTLQWQALRHIFTSKPDAVVVQGSPYELTSWILLLWGRLTGTPVLPWTIGLQGPESGLKWKIRKFMYLMGRGLLVYGDYSRNLLVENGIDPEHIHVIYNSLDLTVQKQALTNLDLAMVAQRRAELAIGDDEQSFCFIGRIVPRKRLHVVLSAIKKLSDQGMQTHFILIGDGDDVPCLEKIAKQLGIEDLVHLLVVSTKKSRSQNI